MKKENINVLTGEEARKVLGEILESERKSPRFEFPAHVGAVGYFRDTTGEGNNVYAAFDHSSGDCWCEDFKTREGAEKWCRGELSTDEVRELESNVEEIILSKDSFVEYLKGCIGDTPNQMPPYVKFDEHGEMAIDMQFFDGYAFDTNPHGLGTYDRIAMYYPTVAEVAKNPQMQEEIEDYIDRRWAEGSKQEQIYDIALKFGKAGRLRCPQDRIEAAVSAIVERAADPSATSFTASVPKDLPLSSKPSFFISLQGARVASSMPPQTGTDIFFPLMVTSFIGVLFHPIKHLFAILVCFMGSWLDSPLPLLVNEAKIDYSEILTVVIIGQVVKFFDALAHEKDIVTV